MSRHLLSYIVRASTEGLSDRKEADSIFRFIHETTAAVSSSFEVMMTEFNWMLLMEGQQQVDTDRHAGSLCMRLVQSNDGAMVR